MAELGRCDRDLLSEMFAVYPALHRKLANPCFMLGEVKLLCQRHTAKKWESPDSIPSLPAPST